MEYLGRLDNGPPLCYLAFMARPTLADVRRRALFHADLIKGNTIEVVDQNTCVNKGLASLHNLVTGSAGGEDYIVVSGVITTSANTAAYDLPDNFKHLRELFYVFGTDEKIPVERFALRDMAGAVSSTVHSWWRSAPFRYRLVGQKQIRFDPTPQQAHNLELWYVPENRPLVQDNEPIPDWIAEGWEEYAALCAAEAMMARLERPIGDIAVLKQQSAQQILTDLKPRDRARPHQVIDVERRWNNRRYEGDY